MMPGYGITICHKQPNGKNDFCLHLPGGGLVPLDIKAQQPPAIDGNSGLYAGFLSDALAVSRILSAVQGISDETTRQALQSGVESAVKALHAHVSPHGLSINLHK